MHRQTRGITKGFRSKFMFSINFEKTYNVSLFLVLELSIKNSKNYDKIKLLIKY